ncbi:hypothetical protein KUF71_013709 [Frankliniella fusca]|uniref:Uncharacterized protein n=1 Tax=Frankliniella fusca TaxID=407009 RepID=A0AAE1I461_9NEOP|nr:hypothetical protein KUF71_013709 [Frankliniella fusca]
MSLSSLKEYLLTPISITEIQIPTKTLIHLKSSFSTVPVCSGDNIFNPIEGLNASGMDESQQEEVGAYLLPDPVNVNDYVAEVNHNIADNRAPIEVNRDGQDGVLNVSDGGVNEDLSSQSEHFESEGDMNDDHLEDSEEEERQDEERQDPDEPDDRPLYLGAQLTLRENLIPIITFVLTHHLTGNSLIDLLSLIILHCPLNSICVKSLYSFKKFFKDVGKEILICHYYCSVCFKMITERNAPCEQCDRISGTSYFIEIPLFNQLQILFSRPGFYNQLQYRFQRQKKHANNIEDIYDGAIYKEQVNNGFSS